MISGAKGGLTLAQVKGVANELMSGREHAKRIEE